MGMTKKKRSPRKKTPKVKVNHMTGQVYDKFEDFYEHDADDNFVGVYSIYLPRFRDLEEWFEIRGPVKPWVIRIL